MLDFVTGLQILLIVLVAMTFFAGVWIIGECFDSWGDLIKSLTDKEYNYLSFVFRKGKHISFKPEDKPRLTNGYGNVGGRICHPMAVGEMWFPRTAIRRRQEALPSVRHPAAPEPLMLHSARDEKGKAQESIGSWAFPKNYITLNPSSSPSPS